MPEDSFLHSFGSQWREMVCHLWPQTPRERAQAELARLDAELTQRQSRLLLFRKKIEKLRHCLEHRELRLSMLAALAKNTPLNAGVRAEWEQQQQTVERLRERIEERERVYARRLARLRKQKQQRTELRVQLLSGMWPKPEDEESDSDYPY